MFLKGGGARVNGDSLLPIKWLCLALPTAPLSQGLILVVAALSEIKMCTPLLPHSLTLRSTYVGEWTGPVLAHTLVIVSTYA